MKTSKKAILSAAATVLMLAACAKSGDSSTSDSSSGSAAICSTVNSAAVSCSGSTLSGCYSGAITVPAGATCNFSGLVVVKSGGSLTIGAGATMKANPGQSPASSVIIDTGATINANGTAGSPIVFTSGSNVGSRVVQDWGGLILRGRATHNFTTATFTTEFDDGASAGSSNARLAAAADDAVQEGERQHDADPCPRGLRRVQSKKEPAREGIHIRANNGEVTYCNEGLR